MYAHESIIYEVKNKFQQELLFARNVFNFVGCNLNTHILVTGRETDEPKKKN